MNKMRRKGFFKRLAVCSLSLAMLASFTACGKPSNVGGKIAVICKNDKVSFWEEVKTGAEDCCDEMGYDLLYYCASSDNDFASQIEYVNDAIDKGAKAIVIAPNDPDELNDVFDKATRKGIKIVNINSRSNYDGVVSYVGSSDFDGGAVAARNASQLYFAGISEEDENIGKIAMIGHTASTADLRLTGFRATFSPVLGQFIGKQQAAKAQAAAAKAQAEAEAEKAKAGSGNGASAGGDSAIQNAAKAAATQASQAGAPEPAILAAAQGAARNAAPAGTPEEAIQAAAQAAVQAVTGGASGAAEETTQPATEETTQGGPPEGNTQGGPPAGGADMIADYFIEGERCGTLDAAYEEAKKLLTQNTDIKVMYTTNTNTTLGACKAVEELDLADSVIVVGFNSDEQELKYVKSGVLDGTIIQNPYNIGYIGIRYAIQASQGQGVSGSLDTGVTWISAKNINDDDIQLLLYPEKA